VALDAQTGAYRWHYQTTPGESWDYTATQPIILADLTIDGRVRKVAMQAPKNGFFYVVDRSNGALISAKPGFWNIGIVGGPLPDAVGEVVQNSATGALLAWDPVAQEEVWRAERAGAWNGGTLATAGGLVFQGTVDGRFLGLDAATGKQLWEYDNQAATLAGPVSYQVGDEQYVAVTAGYGAAFFLIAGFQLPKLGALINGRVYAYKLGGTAAKPTIAPTGVLASSATASRW
jgi:glucose dehydrogenase